MENYQSVYLKKGKDESLRRRHPWVFSGALSHADDGVSEGDIVNVVSYDGEVMGVGHFQLGSIAVRMLAFENIEIDDSFWNLRLALALNVRKNIGLTENTQGNTFRLVHGEGDQLPGLVIDCYGETAVIQAHSVGMHESRISISNSLMQLDGLNIKNVYYKSETTLPYKAGVETENGFLVGDNAGDIAIENGLRFRIDWLRGQKTGFFIDQRDNRQLLESYAKGKNVLNMFCYTGGFSVYALRGGANLVHSVDSSEKAISLTRQNVELNFPADNRHQAFCEDAFRFLDKASEKYDLIVLDPPAFAKHRHALHNALKGYTRLNAKGIEMVKPGGIVFTFSCSQAVSKEQFQAAVFTAALRARRNVRILHQMHQPADHPINIYHPEGEYLKGLVLYVE